MIVVSLQPVAPCSLPGTKLDRLRREATKRKNLVDAAALTMKFWARIASNRPSPQNIALRNDARQKQLVAQAAYELAHAELEKAKRRP